MYNTLTTNVQCIHCTRIYTRSHARVYTNVYTGPLRDNVHLRGRGTGIPIRYTVRGVSVRHELADIRVRQAAG